LPDSQVILIFVKNAVPGSSLKCKNTRNFARQNKQKPEALQGKCLWLFNPKKYIPVGRLIILNKRLRKKENGKLKRILYNLKTVLLRRVLYDSFPY